MLRFDEFDKIKIKSIYICKCSFQHLSVNFIWMFVILILVCDRSKPLIKLNKNEIAI